MTDSNEQIMKAQQLSDLRVVMLKNIQEGRPADAGVSEENIRDMLEGVRRKRAEAWERGAKKGQKAAKPAGSSAPSASKAKKPSGPLSSAGLGLLAALSAAKES